MQLRQAPPRSRLPAASRSRTRREGSMAEGASVQPGVAIRARRPVPGGTFGAQCHLEHARALELRRIRMPGARPSRSRGRRTSPAAPSRPGSRSGSTECSPHVLWHGRPRSGRRGERARRAGGSRPTARPRSHRQRAAATAAPPPSRDDPRPRLRGGAARRPADASEPPGGSYRTVVNPRQVGRLSFDAVRVEDERAGGCRTRRRKARPRTSTLSRVTSGRARTQQSRS